MKKLLIQTFACILFTLSFSFYANGQRSISGVLNTKKTVTHSHNIIRPNSLTQKCGLKDKLLNLDKNDPSLKTKREFIEKKMQDWIKVNRNNRSQQTITIPVVIHVLYTNQAQNVSDTRIHEQIAVLNEDFRRLNPDTNLTPSPFKSLAADCNIEFCLASTDPNGNPTTGITRTHTAISAIGNPNVNKYFLTSQGGHDIWDRDSYMNIWVCDVGGYAAGYATYPGLFPADQDGIVIDFQSFGKTGTYAPTNLGRTATHEVGHWLNLIHIWGDSNCGDDNVADTPTQKEANLFVCPNFPRNPYSCNSSNSNGDMFMNYMDYVNDNCYNMFSKGQKTRMWAAINTYRSSLFYSQGCYGNTSNVPNQICETVTNIGINDTLTLYMLYGSSWGSLSGHNNYQDISKADKYSAPNSSKNILTSARFEFGYAKGSGNIKISVWDNSLNGPGNILTSETISIPSIINDVINQTYTEVNFSNPISLSSDYYIGFEMTYQPGDTVYLYTNTKTLNKPNSGWEQWSNGSWYSYDNSWQMDLAHAIYPVLCSPLVGVERIENDLASKVFPNPTSGKLYIKTNTVNDYEVKVINSIGQLLHFQKFEGKNPGHVLLNMNKMPKGLYFIKVLNNEITETHKVILK